MNRIKNVEKFYRKLLAIPKLNDYNMGQVDIKLASIHIYDEV